MTYLLFRGFLAWWVGNWTRLLYDELWMRRVSCDMTLKIEEDLTWVASVLPILMIAMPRWTFCKACHQSSDRLETCLASSPELRIYVCLPQGETKSILSCSGRPRRHSRQSAHDKRKYDIFRVIITRWSMALYNTVIPNLHTN